MVSITTKEMISELKKRIENLSGIEVMIIRRVPNFDVVYQTQECSSVDDQTGILNECPYINTDNGQCTFDEDPLICPKCNAMWVEEGLVPEGGLKSQDDD